MLQLSDAIVCHLAEVSPRAQGGDHSDVIISNDFNLTPPDTVHLPTHVSGINDVVTWN